MATNRREQSNTDRDPDSPGHSFSENDTQDLTSKYEVMHS